jgi:hypothetical protein
MRAKELKRCLTFQSQVFSGLDESKADKLTLEPILGCFHGLEESQRCSTYPSLFSQPDESKRAKKTLSSHFTETRAKELQIHLSSFYH